MTTPSSLESLLTKNGNASVDDVKALLATVTEQPSLEAVRLATRKNNTAVMNLLLSYGHPIADNGDPLVCVAAYWGHVEALQVLVDHGFSLDTPSIMGMTALLFACQQRRVAAFEWLLAHGASTANKKLRSSLLADAVGAMSGDSSLELLHVLFRENLCDDINDPMLELLACAPNVETAEFLLAHGASATHQMFLNVRIPSPIERCGNSAAMTRLLLRYGAGADRADLNRALFKWQMGPVCVDALCALLEGGADPNATDAATGDSILMRVSHAMFKPLIEAGADVNHRNYRGECVLMRAAGRSFQEFVVGDLLAAGADPSDCSVDENGNSLLNLCCHSRGSIDVVEQLLARGADINLPNRYGSTPLHSACSSHNLPLIKLLLSHNADIRAIDVRRQTPAHCALIMTENDRRDPAVDVLAIINCLINAGVDVAAQDETEATILHIAAAYCTDVRIVETILQASSLPSAVNHRATQGTPMHYAAHGGVVTVGRALFRAGANAAASVSARETHSTPLHVAAFANRPAFVEFLIRECHVDVDTPGEECTPLQFACVPSRIDAAIVMLLNGADFCRVVPDNSAESIEEQLRLVLHMRIGHSVSHVAAGIGKLRVAAIRRRGAEVAIAMQALELPAHLTVRILKHVLVDIAAMPYSQLWELATLVKHWRKQT
jgi:ankyrin repeat protein